MKKVFYIMAAVMLAASVAYAAPIRVLTYPLEVVNAATGTVTLEWDDGSGGTADATLMYGAVSNAYSVTIAAGSSGTMSFTPAAVGMDEGVYYFRLSNTAGGADCWSNEYRLFIGNSPEVDLKNIKMTPSPFSPHLGGLNISYIPVSIKSTAVKVTIKAYTMKGKHVATIIDGAMRTVGAVNTDIWDGRDTLGYYCKNGRYMMQMEVEDTTGYRQHIEPIILVK